MKFSLFPLLSEEDKAERSEGGLDPLGLVQISESLGVRLVPGVRERMSHPRYLTAMAVALEVCRDFPEDKVASDGITPPWLVFEWLMVEGLVRTAQGQDGFGLTGSRKATTALRRNASMSAARHLKTPTVTSEYLCKRECRPFTTGEPPFTLLLQGSREVIKVRVA